MIEILGPVIPEVTVTTLHVHVSGVPRADPTHGREPLMSA